LRREARGASSSTTSRRRWRCCESLAPELGLIHTQGETLGSFDQAQQRGLLDRFGGIATDDVAAAFADWRTTTERLAELTGLEQDRMRMADLWRFQAREIADAQLAAEDEDAQLEAEKLVLANAEKLYTAARARMSCCMSRRARPRRR